MLIDRSKLIEVLEDAYSAYYDLVKDVDTELPLVFRADYRDRDEHYFFTKSAKIWANEKNEYCYLFSAPRFDPETVKACVDFALADAVRDGLTGLGFAIEDTPQGAVWKRA